MFSEYFNAAEKHLLSIGVTPVISTGSLVSEKQLDETEHIIGCAIPAELRLFFREMGDGYQFSPDEAQEGFCLGLLEDYKFQIPGFSDSIREEARPEMCRNNPWTIVQRELERRVKWFPFCNFGGGGPLLCLDPAEDPALVRYYDSLYWPNDNPDEWSFKLSDSLQGFVRSWSRFCFSGPLISLTMHGVGNFDWLPSRFDPTFDRGTSDF